MATGAGWPAAARRVRRRTGCVIALAVALGVGIASPPGLEDWIRWIGDRIRGSAHLSPESGAEPGPRAGCFAAKAMLPMKRPGPDGRDRQEHIANRAV